MIQACLFDLDGVLTDTAEYHFLAWQHVANDLGIAFSRENNDQLRGVSRRQSLAIMLQGKKVTEQQAEQLMEKKNSYYKSLITNMTPKDVLPGAIELLMFLRKKKIKIAIASVSKNAQQVIKYLKLSSYIDELVDGFAVTQSKPEPDIFLYAAKKLKVQPSCCVVIEDAAAGVQAAHRAGMICIGVGTAALGADIAIIAIGAIAPSLFLQKANTSQLQQTKEKGGE